jgi:protein-S-isoprenylcysteine O-methyltransferase Ste14
MVGLFRWLTILTWLIWFVFYWGAGTRSFITDVSHSSELDRISMLIMAVGALGLFGSMVLVLLGIVTLPQDEVVVLIGAVLACVGVGASFYCRHVLGRFWTAPTALQENHEIIDKGPYGMVRHPIYTVTLGFYLGTTLAFFAWWTGALLTLLLLGYVLKALDEERFLGANLAAAYDDYRRRVPYRLLPGVW